MSAVGRLVAFFLILVLVFGGGLAIGAAVGPIDDGDPAVTAPASDTHRPVRPASGKTLTVAEQNDAETHDTAHGAGQGTAEP